MAVAVYHWSQGVISRLRRRHPGIDPATIRPAISTEGWVEQWNAANPSHPASLHPAGRAEVLWIEASDYSPLPLESIKAIDVPAPHVVVVPFGRVGGELGPVVAADGRFLAETFYPISDPETQYGGDNSTGLPLPPTILGGLRYPPRVLEGTVAVLAAMNGRGYFHWLFDVLPKVGVLEAAGFGQRDIDYYLVPSYYADFQVQSLEALGIKRRQLIAGVQVPHLQASTVLATSHTRATGLVPQWVVDFLRRSYPPRRPKGWEGDPPRRIYVIRRHTDHGVIANETALIEALRPHGVAAAVMESLTMEEKAWLFSAAELVIGATGAGLANVVFCPPGGTLVELKARNEWVFDFMDAARRRGMGYRPVRPPGPIAGDRPVTMPAAVVTAAIEASG
jgi:hypothetical protein